MSRIQNSVFFCVCLHPSRFFSVLQHSLLDEEQITFDAVAPSAQQRDNGSAVPVLTYIQHITAIGVHIETEWFASAFSVFHVDDVCTFSISPKAFTEAIRLASKAEAFSWQIDKHSPNQLICRFYRYAHNSYIDAAPDLTWARTLQETLDDNVPQAVDPGDENRFNYYIDSADWKQAVELASVCGHTIVELAPVGFDTPAHTGAKETIPGSLQFVSMTQDHASLTNILKQALRTYPVVQTTASPESIQITGMKAFVQLCSVSAVVSVFVAEAGVMITYVVHPTNEASRNGATLKQLATNHQDTFARVRVMLAPRVRPDAE